MGHIATTRQTGRRTSPRAAALLSLALVPGLLGACGVVDRAVTSSSAGSGASDADPVRSSEPADTTSGTPTDGATDGAEDASTGDAEGEVIGSSTGQLVANPLNEETVPLRLDVLSLARLDGDAVEVRFTITNVGSGEVVYEPWSTLTDPGAEAATYDVSGVTLLDLPDDKRYLTLLDTSGVCLCTTFSTSDLPVPVGESLELYAQFVAPPETTTTVDLAVPGFAPVSGLEIG